MFLNVFNGELGFRVLMILGMIEGYGHIQGVVVNCLRVSHQAEELEFGRIGETKNSPDGEFLPDFPGKRLNSRRI